ncbi:enoyl-CoA hydratase/isomerase family protein [Streptomyces thermoviolaceus]|uniref:Enoyl-CoA hydratase/isomerase family protein n=1 Tax=Streptomyces thermoviolaceus subsp. thermoviolaceus TaxID=66860 RepID=A0ABX0YTA0_STRTL|nr:MULTISPECIES: enoyl-CoA hydratase/isomerase family protein [Streptomyces]MCM3266242.1 enoyl-CoA hydratase/isomerase family protein [Streptomyces thermoviolaceus]NJP14356.1 enoyl-CoA hydratase/isomerase family protein [Streptomyces thermoviolaceus subsp. thermoviolaceus]RSS00706.1 enoyl-CoA hydratase/isomerase family protein [Streptomyces sp. WAC00469]WTD49766.1 enoyl-CoA hydratase/isomerase family protein [Streptomyces thermoviolaceus]GGV81435.1 enoyl-CoA hydratase [Streptomyces thermoviola
MTSLEHDLESQREGRDPADDNSPAPAVLDKDGVRLAVDGAVATVTLTNPAKRNVQSPAFWRALIEAGRLLPGSVRVVLLRAEGKSFSAGLNRQAFTPEGIDGELSFFDLARSDDAELDATIATYQEAFTWWRRSDLVSIAAVQGHAIGAGFQLALACDLRVVADDVQFAMRETSLGLVPDLTGTHPLVSLVGYGRALEICLTGRFVSAEEAVASGLANIAVPRDQLDAAAQDLASAILAAPRDAVIETKALLQGAQGRTYDEQRAAERQAQARRLRDLAGLGD